MAKALNFADLTQELVDVTSSITAKKSTGKRAALVANAKGVTKKTDHTESLRKSLRVAIQLELSTIPPYLAAYWSVKNSADPVAILIRSVVLEEMGHLGLACNLLVGLGESPNLASGAYVPSYPGPLPGGVHKGLEVVLRRLTPSQIKVFSDIEYPEAGPVGRMKPTASGTIGAFYDALLKAFRAIKPTLDPSKQRDEPITGIFKVNNLLDVKKAIDQIRHQGEGTSKTPDASGGELAHFYKFSEIYVGTEFVFDATTKKWGYTGAPVVMPEVFPMADIPKGGYKQADVSNAVWTKLNTFDQTYTLMMKQLTAAWTDPTKPLGDFSPNDPILTMSQLPGPAIDLMKLPRPDGKGNYGPCFRLV